MRCLEGEVKVDDNKISPPSRAEMKVSCELLSLLQGETVFIIFPKSTNTFQYPLSKRVYKRLSKHLSRVCYIYHRTLSRVRVERKALSLRSLHCAVWPCIMLGTRGRRYKGVQSFKTTLRLSSLQKRCFWVKRVSDHNFFGVSERRFLPPNQNSFAFIICKNHPESRLETLILHQKCDDKRTPSVTLKCNCLKKMYLWNLDACCSCPIQ